MKNLLWLFLTPLMCSLVAFLSPRLAGRHFKGLAILLSLIPLGMLLMHHADWLGADVNYPWLPSLSIYFHLHIDALSLIFLYLATVIVMISILSVPADRLPFPNTFYGLVFLLQTLLFGFFTARDLAVFTIFWEAMLLPLYFIINIWGGPQREVAALKFLIYMIAGSFLMIAAVLGLYFTALSTGTGTFDIDALAAVTPTAPWAVWLFAIFALAFAVKTPLFPFHAWLPDTYCQAPVAGTILLSGILSKAGIYGFLRVGMELFPDLMRVWSPLFLGLAITGVLYGAFAAWAQMDYKRLIAYSSFSHVNFILVGVFVFTQTAQAGAILQTVNHGITIAALFLVAGWLEERIGTTVMGQVGGLCKFMPRLCWFTLVFVLSSVALPGMNNFIGELMIFLGLFGYNPWLTALLATSIILSVVYMLRWMQLVYFQEPSLFQDRWVDLKAPQVSLAVVLTGIVLWIGIYPSPLLRQIEPAAEKIVAVTELETPK